MSLRSAKVAVLVYDLFEQVEFEEPIRRLLSEGISPTIISANKLSMQAMKHNVPGDLFKADKLIGDANKEDYIALILPGGALNADNLRMNNKAREWIHFFLNNDRLIAAICHAPWLLVSADAIEERRVTSYFTLQDDIRNVGAEWIDQPVVVDGNLITSRKPADLDDFDTAIIDWLST
ncbi:MAG TPA: type 1 glutamine amidotransferase domain-containing protein, partial [Candidatus Saccharimonadales bacterium]|nr:type 1 glutamine amidotransferase domain-containing protein [Candidatus Saccharimonadales bacterium]